MKNHKHQHKWYKPKDRKAIRIKRRERRQKVRHKMGMTIGDYIRHMNDAQLANVLLDTIIANSDCFEEYRIDLGGYISFNVVDAEGLTEKLGEMIEDGNDK